MHRLKKIDPAVLAVAAERVKKSPRGAPETIPHVALAEEALVEEALVEAEVVAIPDVEEEEIPESRPTPPCALDGAPVGSKVILHQDAENEKYAVLVTSLGEQRLSTDDIAWTLPRGARIQRTDDGFRAIQLGAEGMRPDLVTTTAREAIAQFVPHFHR